MTTDANTDPNVAAMGGGLPDMMIPTTPEPIVQEPAVTPPAPQKIVIGDRVFNSSEEALAYANGLAMAQSRTTTETPVVEAPRVKLGQLLFENPDEALEQVEARAVERMRAEQRKVDDERLFWEDFYSKHPDLKGSELLVNAVLWEGQRLGDYNKLSRSEAAPILAARARQEALKIRNVPSGGQALPSKPAMVAGSSGASTPQAPISKPASTDFITELRNMRKRG